MTLKGRAKTDYQREQKKQCCLKRSCPVRPKAISPFGSNHGAKGPTTDVKAKLRKAGLNLDGNLLTRQSKSSPIKQARIPPYDRFRSKAGDRVRMPSGEVVLVPERDAEGNPIYGE